jgi:hypothetical protein
VGRNFTGRGANPAGQAGDYGETLDFEEVGVEFSMKAIF